MSILVAVKKEGQIVLGADTQSTDGPNMCGSDNLIETKIRRVGETLVAAAGWAVYDDILTDYLSEKEPPKLDTRAAIFRFFRDFWKALHQQYSFVNQQCTPDNRTPFADLDSTFLIVTKQQIFTVSNDLSVIETVKFQAMGSGREYAVGAMHALYDMNFDAETIARHGLEAAIVHNVYCGAPVEILHP